MGAAFVESRQLFKRSSFPGDRIIRNNRSTIDRSQYSGRVVHAELSANMSRMYRHRWHAYPHLPGDLLHRFRSHQKFNDFQFPFRQDVSLAHPINSRHLDLQNRHFSL
jgi:hypothetical protein